MSNLMLRLQRAYTITNGVTVVFIVHSLTFEHFGLHNFINVSAQVHTSIHITPLCTAIKLPTPLVDLS